jgi:hypothetical protein
MKISLCGALTLAMLSMTTASFAGPTGWTGTPDSTVSTDQSVGSTAMSGSSDGATFDSQGVSADNGSSGILILPPSGGKGGYPARESNGCQAPGTPQDTGSSIGFGC